MPWTRHIFSGKPCFLLNCFKWCFEDLFKVVLCRCQVLFSVTLEPLTHLSVVLSYSKIHSKPLQTPLNITSLTSRQITHNGSHTSKHIFPSTLVTEWTWYGRSQTANSIIWDLRIINHNQAHRFLPLMSFHIIGLCIHIRWSFHWQTQDALDPLCYPQGLVKTLRLWHFSVWDWKYSRWEILRF